MYVVQSRKKSIIRVLILSLMMMVLYLNSHFVLAAGETTVQPNDPNIEYYGRWDKSVSTSYHSYWGGAYLKVRFTGTSVQLKLNNAVTLLVNIDDTGDRKLSNVSGTVNLTPTVLISGTHTLRVAAEFDTQEIQFGGLLLDAGATTAAPLISGNKIIEFIGDSITTGADDPNGDGDAFGWLAGDMLGAEHTQISDPGIALTDGYGAGQPGMEKAYLKLKTPNYTGTTINWDFSTYTPTAIVVNLGSNDYYTNEDPALFQSHYIDFLANLRSIYPNTEIFALRLFNGWYETETRNAVDAIVATGDTKVHYVDTTGWLQGYGTTTTEDYVQKSSGPSVHPSRVGHVKVARNLAPILKPYLNLPFTQLRVEAEDMALTNYSVESNDSASFLKDIRVPASGTGTASYTFSEASGDYDIQVNYFDENDGASTYSLYAGNTLIGSWTADSDFGTAGADMKALTAKNFSDVHIPQGSVIRIEGTFNQFEAARIDRLKFYSGNANSIVSGATYKIKNLDSGMYIDSDANGVVTLAPSTTYDDQDWIVSKEASGYWSIKNARTGRYYLNTDLDSVVSWNTGGTIYDDALWSLEAVSNGGFRINNKVSGRDYLFTTSTNAVNWNTGATDSSTVWALERK